MVYICFQILSPSLFINRFVCLALFFFSLLVLCSSGPHLEHESFIRLIVKWKFCLVFLLKRLFMLCVKDASLFSCAFPLLLSMRLWRMHVHRACALHLHSAWAQSDAVMTLVWCPLLPSLLHVVAQALMLWHLPGSLGTLHLLLLETHDLPIGMNLNKIFSSGFPTQLSTKPFDRREPKKGTYFSPCGCDISP